MSGHTSEENIAEECSSRSNTMKLTQWTSSEKIDCQLTFKLSIINNKQLINNLRKLIKALKQNKVQHHSIDRHISQAGLHASGKADEFDHSS